ncbi:MAG: protein kinase [Nitrospiraceae bacterium]
MPNSVIAYRYRLIEEIGKGSFATVYKALDTANERHVALKLIEYRGGLERLLRVQQEMAILSKLNHPRVVRILDVGREAESAYLAMELIAGRPLSAHLAEAAPLPCAEAVSLMLQVAEALAHIHRQGIVHRDLKPSNILLQSDGTIKLLDFGLAWMVSLSDRLSSPLVVGTFAYMAPEQTGVLDMPVDTRADLYSLGILFYEILTGVRPFNAPDAASLIHQHVAKLPLMPRTLNPAVPPVLEDIVLKLMRKAPQERYQTASGLSEDLQEYERLVRQGQTEIRMRIGAGERVNRPVSFHTRLIGRTGDLAWLQQAFRAAAQGHGHAALVSGEPGVGKSRIINETRGFVNSLGGLFITGKCTEYSTVFPYSPFVEAIEEYVQRVRNLSPEKREAAVARIKFIIGDMGEELTRLIPSIKLLIGDIYPLTTHAMEPEKHVERFLSVASDFIIGLGGDFMPVALFIDDLQWIDRGSLQLLERVIPKLKNSHVLILGAFRDTAINAQHPLSAFLAIWKPVLAERKLHGLSAENLETLLQELIPLSPEQCKQVAATIFVKTGGNPFYILETMKALIENDALVLHEDGWRVHGDKVEQVSVSSQVDQIILQRTARLSHHTRELLSYAAVIGRRFTFDTLIQLTGHPPATVLNCIDEALSNHIVQRTEALEERGYAFIHDRILESLYENIDEGHRKRLHQRLAEQLEEQGKDRLHDISFELALHFRKGLDPLRTLRYSLMAGDLARRTYANAEAVQFYETALKLLMEGFCESEQDRQEVQLSVRENLGDAYALLGRYEAAKNRYEEVKSHIHGSLAVSRLETKMGIVAFKQGRTDETLKHFGTGLAALGIRQPQTALGVVASILGEVSRQTLHSFMPGHFVRYRPGPYDAQNIEALRLFELLIYYYYFIDMKRCFQVHMKQLNLAERMGSEEYCRVAYGIHALLCNAAGLHQRALRYAEKSQALRNESQQSTPSGPKGLVIGDSPFLNLGRAFYYKADYGSAVRYLESAAEETMKVGNLWETEVAYGHLCMAYFGKGEFDNLLHYARLLNRIAESVNDIRGLGWGQVLQALGHSHQGSYDNALHHARLAVAHCEQAGDQLILVMSLRILGQIHLRKGDVKDALTALERSRAVIVKQQLLHDFVVGTFVIATEALTEAAKEFPLQRASFLRKARRELMVARLLSRVFTNWRAHTLRAWGSYEFTRGRDARGLSLLQQSIAIAEKLGSRYDVAKAHLLIAEEVAHRREPLFNASLGAAKGILRDLGSLPEVLAVERLSGTPSGDLRSPSVELSRHDQQELAVSREFTSLLQVCQSISGILEIKELLDRILEAATAVVGAERGYLLLDEDGHLELKIAKGLVPQEFDTQAFDFSRKLVFEVERTKQPLWTTDAQIDPRFADNESIRQYGLRSILCVPLLRRETLLGIVYLDNRLVANLFTDRHLKLITAFAGQAAIAIENASSYRELQSLADTLEQKVAERTKELTAANDKLHELDVMRTQFVSVVSHELRTPLTGLKGYLENMLEGVTGPLGEKQIHYLGRMKYNVERLTRMVNDLLDLTRIDAGRIELERIALPISNVLFEVIETMQPVARPKNIGLIIEHDPRAGSINADRDKFHQIMINLIQNAIKFTPSGGQITVAAKPSGWHVEFCVSDTGCGIDPTEAGKIFTRFYCGKSTASHERGAGLGLAITQGLVKLHGGDIWVNSMIGEGSRFYFTIPAA